MSESEVAGSDIYLQPSVVFEQGRSYLVRARSGHGKTSLLNFIYGISGQYDGEVVLTENGERRTENATHPALTGTPLREGMANARTENELRTRVLSFMFQDLGLFPQLTAMENVQLKNRLTGFKSDAEIEAMLDVLLPEGKKHQPVATLSLGQRQRVAAVRALCQPFKFILMDEPFSHIDSENARCVADMVMGEVGRQGAGLIVTALDAIDYFPFDVTYNL
ncbi:MAG: ATP-binding cassette domain-containing protein [Bacteroidales bacterium]|nr:ATP-binding cassette domain-containing protein [Bacteroidales bacterium]